MVNVSVVANHRAHSCREYTTRRENRLQRRLEVDRKIEDMVREGSIDLRRSIIFSWSMVSLNQRFWLVLRCFLNPNWKSDAPALAASRPRHSATISHETMKKRLFCCREEQTLTFWRCAKQAMELSCTSSVFFDDGGSDSGKGSGVKWSYRRKRIECRIGRY